MTATIVNLRRARKAKLKAEGAETAACNRALFGRTKEERALQALETSRAEHHLDGHRLDHRLDRAIRPDDGQD